MSKTIEQTFGDIVLDKNIISMDVFIKEFGFNDDEDEDDDEESWYIETKAFLTVLSKNKTEYQLDIIEFEVSEVGATDSYMIQDLISVSRIEGYNNCYHKLKDLMGIDISNDITEKNISALCRLLYWTMGVMYQKEKEELLGLFVIKDYRYFYEEACALGLNPSDKSIVEFFDALGDF